MRIHLIAIGGAAMHNLAIALKENGHDVSGSDDEIYDPSRSRLEKNGLLPAQFGWDENRISEELDIIILGMHARKDNPELLKAQALKLRIYSYPEYVYNASKDKKRIVIGGSHGKTTTTSMIMHVMQYHKMNFDYLVGASIEGFENMVRLSDAPIIVIEGDEYLSSPIDLRSKFLHYHPHTAILTGVAWDHINVFPTFEDYVKQFEKFVASIDKEGDLFYYKNDIYLEKIVRGTEIPKNTKSYGLPEYTLKANQVFLNVATTAYGLSIFGQHNLENLEAARLVCAEYGIDSKSFAEAIQHFKGAAKRLQRIGGNEQGELYIDFAHAPSKVKATTQALKITNENCLLTACVELHTFSSLNKVFLPQYKGSLEQADQAIVFFNEHTLKMKKLEPITSTEIIEAFDHPNLFVFTDKETLKQHLLEQKWEKHNLLMMSSGNFRGLDFLKLCNTIFSA